MDRMIMGMSIIAYLIIFNRGLTFRLTILNNVIITMILAFYMLIIDPLKSGLIVLPMFGTILLYIYWLKKEDILWNIFQLLACYMLVVILDNVSHFILKMADVEPNKYGFAYAIYMMINFPIFYILCGMVSKKAKQIKKLELPVLSPKIIAVVGVDLLLCMLIFAIHITITNEAGSPPMLLLCSVGLYIAYFVLTFVMILMIVREYKVNAQITMRQNSYDNLQEYMSQIEELYQNIRAFRHDYANIMASMSIYLENNDIQGLKAYYDTHIFPINDLLNKENDVISRLNKLDILELKGLVSVKINYALELNITVNLEITERIEAVNMNTLDLVRITGILLDNAIEACQECTSSHIDFCMIKSDQSVTLIVRNTYLKKEIDYNKLGISGITSKGERRGTGLYNVRSMIEKYENVIMDTEYGDAYFTQLIEIYEENQANTL